MQSFFQFIIRIFAAGFSTVVAWLISFFGFDQSFLASGFFAIGTGAAIFYLIKWGFHRYFLSQHGITHREYKFIRRNLKEAKPKIRRLQKSLVNLRSIINLNQNLEIYRVANRIYTTTKKDPRRFFLVEQFYYSHLDTLVELSEKHAFLSSQPTKTSELNESLRETRFMINKMADTVKQDLYNMIEGDIDDLHFELDVAKQTIKRKNDKSNLIK
ncbi:5-bromo-4-chloroindolyl phosphate hydrolysis family protein [Bacillus kwashiorkori]|uniref:5-bromo-4-chloroindolyl phosphate hydrolysis family protein n=1 Tax=Bacillus kwashiorkori TaxID=1522318 RepID=UPI0007838C08|nr:5-bromo-4-chloroindolyl phosphate hydrolysis family protein [Bacillus kwashiorkori]